MTITVAVKVQHSKGVSFCSLEIGSDLFEGFVDSYVTSSLCLPLRDGEFVAVTFGVVFSEVPFSVSLCGFESIDLLVFLHYFGSENVYFTVEFNLTL